LDLLFFLIRQAARQTVWGSSKGLYSRTINPPVAVGYSLHFSDRNRCVRDNVPTCDSGARRPAMENSLGKERNNARRDNHSPRELSQPLDQDSPVRELASFSDWSRVGELDHFVHFYETDRFLLDLLSTFIVTGLRAGDACIVVATQAHRDGLDERLQAFGLDVAAAKASGQFVALDAAETLAKFMVDGSPEPERFVEVVGGIIARVAEGQRRVRAFGEMVALLWAQGNQGAAIQLEELWNQLRKTRPFSLFCAYPIKGFVGDTMGSQLGEVCDAHARVIPAESYTLLADADDRLRAVALLQQKARMLEKEVAERQAAETRLRISEIGYRRLFEASTDGILILDPDTYQITNANPSVIALMGIAQEELLGRELWEVGLLENREAGLALRRELQENGVARYEHLLLKTRAGLHRDIEFVSNVYRTNGHQVIQCNVRDITERRRADEISLHLAAIVESSDDAIISKSLNGTILSWNKGAERLFGYTAEEVIGQSILLLIPPDRQFEEPGILARLTRGERIDHYETIRVTKDGRSVNVSLTVSPIRDKQGRVIAASKIARDITEAKLAEARLREQAEIIETINHTGQTLSAELNLQRVVQVVTDAGTELTGAQFGAFFYNVIDNQGESYMLYTLSGVDRDAFAQFPMPRNTDMFGPTFRGEGTIRLADVKKDPRYGKSSPHHGMPDGHLPVTSYLAVPVVSRGGNVLGGLFFGHPKADVFSERHERLVEGLAAQAAIAMDNAQLYELSQRERAKAEAANRAKDEFLATVSHELRTPLNAIIGWSHMLRRGRLDQAAVSRAVETIERNAKSQAQLIEDILDVSRVITGKLRLNVGPVDVVSVISAAVDSVQLAADSKGINLSVVLDPSARHLSGDASRLQQVVWNLLSNAIKFTPAGGRVEVRLERAGSNARIVVNDTGDGISKDFLPFIFERFRQADGSLTRRQGGLGLGLAIVKHLVELHGGGVRADSAGEGRGATFIIELPLMIGGRRAAARKAENERWGQDENYHAHRQPLPSLEGVQVLVVDDDRDTLEMITAVLTEYGATVQGAASAAEAMDILRCYKPDVLVSDLAMPDEDGYSLIKRVRAADAERDKPIPAVALTALVRIEDRVRALSAGFNMFVPKPVEPDELIAAIATLAEPATARSGQA
jgi:PAS domain S-box-containing protein